MSQPNRHQRRAESVVSKKPHATQSFEQLVANTNRDALKSYVESLVSEMRSVLARQQLASLGNVLTRLTVLEKLALEKLGETEESLMLRTAAEEDRALSLVASSEPAKLGDQVRISFVGYTEGQAPAENRVRACVRHLAQVNAEGRYQVLKQLEEEIVGLRAGESKNIRIDVGQSRTESGEIVKQPDVIFDVLVQTVSVPAKETEAQVEKA